MKKEIRYLFLISILLVSILFSISFGHAVTNPNAGKVKIMFISDNSLSSTDSSSYVYQFINYLNLSRSYNMSNIDINIQGHAYWGVNDFIVGRDNLGSASNWVHQYKPDVVFIQLGSFDIYNNRYKYYNNSLLIDQISKLVDSIRAQNPYTVFFISNMVFYDSTTNSYNYQNIIDFNSKLNMLINEKYSWSSNVFMVNSFSTSYAVTLQYPYNFYYNLPATRFIASSMFNSISNYWNACNNYELANFCKSSYWCGAANSTVLQPNVIFPDNLTLPSINNNRFLCASDGRIYRCGYDSLQNINDTFYLNTFSNISQQGVKNGFFTCSNDNTWQFCNNNGVCESNKGENMQNCPADCQIPVCTFNYTSWSDCASNGIQTRGILSQSPFGCTGGSPVLNQSCNYINQTIISIQQNYFCTPNSTISCDPIDYGVRIGYGNKCNENGSTYLNISNCSIICNTGFTLSGDSCVNVPVTLNDSNSTNQTDSNITTVDNSPYPVYNPILSNYNNNSYYYPIVNYSASINNPTVSEILNIGGDNSSTVNGNTQNSFISDNQVPLIIIALIIILSILIFLWIFFKFGSNKDNKKPDGSINQNNRFKPRPPIQPGQMLVRRPLVINRPNIQI